MKAQITGGPFHFTNTSSADSRWKTDELSSDTEPENENVQSIIKIIKLIFIFRLG